jgi:hypothetical protein
MNLSLRSFLWVHKGRIAISPSLTDSRAAPHRLLRAAANPRTVSRRFEALWHCSSQCSRDLALTNGSLVLWSLIRSFCLIPVLADPKKLVQALETLRTLKSFPSADAVNTTTGPQLPKYVSAAFGSLDLPWKTRTPPKRLRRHLLPQVQTQKPDRRYLSRPNPRPQTPRSKRIPLGRAIL